MHFSPPSLSNRFLCSFPVKVENVSSTLFVDHMASFIRNRLVREVPDGPVVQTLQGEGPSPDPWPGDWTPRAKLRGTGSTGDAHAATQTWGSHADQY